jgi:hypothetical protein
MVQDEAENQSFLSLQLGNDHHLEECDFSATAFAGRKVEVNFRKRTAGMSYLRCNGSRAEQNGLR